MSIDAYRNQPQEQALLESVEGAAFDPFLKSVFDKMRLYNELLANEAQSEPEINAIMHEIDAEWQSLIGEKVTFTGIAWFLDERQMTADAIPVRSYYEDDEMVFKGVGPHEMYHDYDTDNRYYELRILLEREAIDDDGKLIALRGTSTLDEVASLEFKGSMSVLRARRILELHAPQLIEEIDLALLNEAETETELLCRLEHIVADDGIFAGFDDTALAELIQALDIYTNSLLTYDSGAPYHVRVEGDIWLAREDDIVAAIIHNSSKLARINRVAWGRMSEDGPRTVRPLLDLYLLASGKDEKETHIYVPFSTVKQLSSIRHMFYSGQLENDS